MVFNGVRHPDLRGWTRRAKISTEVTSTSTGAIAAATTADALSTGTQVKLLPNYGMRVLRYLCGISTGARAFYIITPGVIVVSIAPTFGPAGLAIAEYQEPYIPAVASANVATSGSFSAHPGMTLQLVDDWYQFDDYHEVGTFPLVVQFQSQWTVRNASGAADSCGIGPEFILYELWERSSRYA